MARLSSKLFAVLQLALLLVAATPSMGFYTRFLKASSVSCGSSASSSTSTSSGSSGTGRGASQGAHKAAITRAVLTACNPDWDGDIEKVMVSIGSDYVTAYAATLTKASCTTSGGGSGCASASASARSSNRRIARWYVQAFAKAIAKCPHCKTSATAVAQGKLNYWAKLIVKAASQSSAYACSSGNGVASAASKCFANAYLHLFAISVSKAVIKGDCHEPEAKADIEGTVVTYDWSVAQCHTSALAYGDDGQADAFGNAYTKTHIFDD